MSYNISIKYKSGVFLLLEKFQYYMTLSSSAKINKVLFTCMGSTTRATQIIATTKSLEDHVSGVTSPKPTVENVTMQK